MEGEQSMQRVKEYEERAKKLVISFETELKNIDLRELKTKAIHNEKIDDYLVDTSFPAESRLLFKILSPLNSCCRTLRLVSIRIFIFFQNQIS